MILKLNNFELNIKGSAHSDLEVSIKGLKKNSIYEPTILEEFLERRKPKEAYETKRRDLDLINIKKGIKDNKIKSNIIVSIKTNNTSLNNYAQFNTHPRPGHADYARIKKYGSITSAQSDIYSGRMTIGYVLAGAFIKMNTPNIIVSSELVQVGSECDKDKFNSLLNTTKEKYDSISGIVKLTIKNIPPGLGGRESEPLDSRISSLLYMVPGVKAISFGLPFSELSKLGSVYNDLIIDENGSSTTNNAGGVIGGLSNGNDIVIYVFLRPAASIYLTQKTFNLETKKIEPLTISGSHDSFYINRARVVLESMLYISLYSYLK